MLWIKAVSYTHLDVYKRQLYFLSVAVDDFFLEVQCGELYPVGCREGSTVVDSLIAVSYTHLNPRIYSEFYVQVCFVFVRIGFGIRSAGTQVLDAGNIDRINIVTYNTCLLYTSIPAFLALVLLGVTYTTSFCWR